MRCTGWRENRSIRRKSEYKPLDCQKFRQQQRQILSELKQPGIPDSEDCENPIDAFLEIRYQERKVQPEEKCDDATFLRRAYLDAIGLLPAEDELQGFLQDTSSDKREKLIDYLLNNRQPYAEHWMTFWNDLLRNDEQTNIDGLRQPITRWLYDSLLSNKPYDQLVMEILNPDPNGPTGFLNGVQWRGRINASQRPVIQAAQSISQVMLATPMKCASCHDHFTKEWKLQDTYGLAAAFSEEGKLEMYRCDKPLGEFAEAGFPFEGLGEISRDADVYTRREQAALMVVSPKNPRFAKTMVNRLWHKLIGVGLFEPVDDLDYGSNYPELLDWLAYDFMAHDYDLKHTLRLIMTSDLYSRKAQQSKSLVDYDPDYAAPKIRRLQSEQFLDGIYRVTEYHPNIQTMNVDVDNTNLRAWRDKKPTLLAMALGRPTREQVTSERVDEATVLQMLEMVNGNTFAELLKNAAQYITSEDSSLPGHAEALVAKLVRRAYSREITADEKKFLLEMLAPNDKGHFATEHLEDVLWVIFMSPEFQFIH